MELYWTDADVAMCSCTDLLSPLRLLLPKLPVYVPASAAITSLCSAGCDVVKLLTLSPESTEGGFFLFLLKNLFAVTLAEITKKKSSH